MRFSSAAVASLVTTAGAAKLSSFTSLKKVPDHAFVNVPSLAAKDRQNRAELNNKIKAAARPTERSLNDGNGNWNNANSWGQYNDYWNEDMVVEEFGFNIDQYSLKYTGCHVAKGWDDNVAENENYDTVLGAETFVTFRLCPSNSCQGENGYRYGCQENFGEYMLLLDEYVEALTEYRAQKKLSFCEYCELCAAMKGYKAWNYMMQTTSAVAAQAADAQFQAWYEAYMYQANQGDEGGNGDQEQAKITYMKLASQQANNNGYYYGNDGNNDGNDADGDGNGDANGNNNNYYMDMQEFIGSQSQFWNFQNNAFSFEDGDQDQTYYWMNLDAEYATFCGKPILSGYFSDAGEFVEDYGYWNCYGDWVSFSNAQAWVWDECCMGEIPHGWENVQGNDPYNFQECDSQYANTCSSAYMECQFALYYDEMDAKYQQLLANAGYDGSSSSDLESFEAVYEKQEAERVYSNALTCQQVDYAPEEEAMEQSAYNNQQNYEALYEQKQYYLQAEQDCNNDEECIAAIEEAMQMNNDYQLWIIQSAWDEYQTYRNLNEQFYVGAYCEDNWNIGLRVFTDEKCVVEHPSASVQDVLGENVGISYDLVSGECIPCNDDQFRVGVVDNGEEDNIVDGVLPFCSMLYQLAAKCNEHLTPSKVYNAAGFYQDGVYYAPSFSLMYGSEQQQDNEKKICAMIDSLNSGTYQEDGSIYLGHLGWLSPQKWQNEISSASSGMPKGMRAFIFILVICSAAMALWASVLRGALRRKSQPWQPKDPVDLARQESGIVMGRSRSGPANAPLI